MVFFRSPLVLWAAAASSRESKSALILIVRAMTVCDTPTFHAYTYTDTHILYPNPPNPAGFSV